MISPGILGAVRPCTVEGSEKSSSKPQSTRPHQRVRLGCPIPAKFRTHGWLIVQPPRILVDSNSSKRLKIVHVRRQLFVGAVFGESLG